MAGIERERSKREEDDVWQQCIEYLTYLPRVVLMWIGFQYEWLPQLASTPDTW